MSINFQENKGFVALVSAIVISILLLAITLALTFSGFFARFNVLDSESKERSLALAESCADTAILNLAEDVAYNPVNQIVNVGSDTCKIISKQVSGSSVTFKTQAVFNHAFTDLKIVLDSNTFTINSWDECATLASC